MFSNLNIDNADLKYISLKSMGDDLIRYSNYRKFTLGLSRLNPLSILDFFKILYNKSLIDSDLFIHTCDFHSVALALFWKFFRPKNIIIYANHDAIPHLGYSLARRIIINSITRVLFRTATEVQFFSAHNRKVALNTYSFLRYKKNKLVPLPTPAEKYPVSLIDKQQVLLAFGRDSKYKMDITYLHSLESLINSKGLELRKVGGMAENLFLSKLNLDTRPIEVKGYVDEEILIKHCDESQFVLLNYSDISQSGIVNFARARGCNLVMNERMKEIIETKPGDLILTKTGWYEC